MDVNKILAELREERDRIEEAIVALQRVGGSGPKRRGRPPQWMVDARQKAADVPKKRGRPPKEKPAT
jgi:hypothetical protein